MQPAQTKLRPTENFLHPAKILPPYFAGKIKRAQTNDEATFCKPEYNYHGVIIA